ncbi:Putative F-box protein [Striga hermonthica]|uniref:F-box protein n=1 Tax=Striga hermonthica TaxID=68872 RepID=A0A9N7N2M2_STRHE|nr:Putative F-box protein [Striga hermonthica]
MASSFSITRSIGRKWFAGLSNYPIVCLTGSSSFRTLAEPMFSSSTRQNPSSSPWLMLPPAFDVTVTGAASFSYKFYNPADNKVVSLDTGKSCRHERELTHLDMCFAGSSRGWLALLSPSFDLFLYNPISRRHIKLPPVRDLPEFPPGSPVIYKLILSCSPDTPNCRAIILYNSMYALAFCCPGFSKEWTHIGEHQWLDPNSGEPFRNLEDGYWDCVYSTRHEALFTLTRDGVLESWDLRDPHSLRAVKIAEVRTRGRCNFSYRKRQPQLKLSCESVDHLIVFGQDLFVVTHFCVDCFDFDGLYVDSSDPYQETHLRGLPYVTIAFKVYKYNPENQDVKKVKSLDGLALFVGYHGDSFALPAAEFPGLEPNSIYFTNGLDDVICPDVPIGGHDIGIFNYKNKTVLPCYYPSDVKNMSKIFPGPTWFFPSPA